MRAFLALDISSQAREGISEAIRVLRPESFRVKWVDPSLIHVTLKFFADLPEGLVDPASAALRAVAQKTPPFIFKVSGLGYFGQRDRMRVLWCGVAEGAELVSALQRDVDNALAPLGLPLEQRPFNPHLTIGRLREPSREPGLAKALDRMNALKLGEVRAESLVLFSSVLTPRGPIYKAERTWPFEVSP